MNAREALKQIAISGAGRLQEKLFGPSAVDYRHPAGDPGFFGPDSVTWRVHSNPVALAVGGVAAVILELAEPRVRAGVWDHSSFRTDPLTRMRRTADATMLTTYGPTAAVEERVALVNRMHRKVTGVAADGQPYHAMDPELLRWVQVTAGYGFLNAYLRFVEPLTPAEQDRYYAEGARLGHLFGASGLPATVAEAEALFQAMRPKLGPDPVIGEFLGLVSRTSPIGLPGRAVQPLLVQASIDLLPNWARRQLDLPSRPLMGAAAYSAMRASAAAARLIPGGIVAEARERAAVRGASTLAEAH